MIDATTLATGPEEVAPLCPHFGACGGCQLQHLQYPTQIERKQQALTALLASAIPETLPPVTPHAAEPWHYRNRIRLRLDRVDGVWRAGYNRKAGTTFLPITQCPIAAEPLWQCASALLDLANTDSAASTLLEAAGELELFASHDLSRLQLTFFARNKKTPAPKTFAATLAQLEDNLPFALAGAALVYADPQSGRILRTLTEVGSAGLAYRVEDESYWITRGGFFQVNRFLLETLVSLVTQSHAHARQGDLAWDLFAGVGLFTRVLARNFARVTAVESNPSAVADLRSFLTRLNPLNSAIEATTLDFLRSAVVDRDRPSLVVLDPPRAGAGIEACNLLTRIAPQTIVYVSCDPTTLARDLAALRERYRVTRLDMVDLFPQTTHVETIATLDRML